MTEAALIAAFETALRAAATRFKMEEEFIRAQQTKDVAAGAAPAVLDIEEMLERPTRRFLIDPMLRAHDWDPNNPHQVTEEARSWAEDGERLYFDYLGLNRQRAPTMLVEARGADADTARPPRGADGGGAKMALLISEGFDSLKAGTRPSAVLAQWAAWLDDLRIYVRSLGSVERSTLRRVVITAGRWLIVFIDPLAAFIDEGLLPPAGLFVIVRRLQHFHRRSAHVGVGRQVAARSGSLRAARQARRRGRGAGGAGGQEHAEPSGACAGRERVDALSQDRP